MPHHFTKDTVEASIWCNHCNKETPWRIADGRRQYCLICRARKPIQLKLEPEPTQMTFSDVAPNIEVK